MVAGTWLAITSGMQNTKKQNALTLIRKYFGENQKLHDFKVELDTLSVEDKLDLARGIALEFDLSQDDVSFPLTDAK